MQEILTVLQSCEADRLATRAGIKSYTLMGRAGEALAKRVIAVRDSQAIQVLCGPGANGGDGYVAAKILRKAGHEVAVSCLGDPAQLKGDAKRAFQDWGGPVAPAHSAAIQHGSVVVDALFGAGLSRPLTGEAAALVQALNAAHCTVISADLPSGIHGDHGAASDVHVRADETVTFFRKKPAHVLQPSRAACGTIHVVDIGICDRVLDSIAPQVFENCPALWPDLPPVPAIMVHKHTRGHVLVRCGGEFSTGAARLAARAGLRGGAGLVTVLAGKKAARVCAMHETEIMITSRTRDCALAAVLQNLRISAVVIGPAGGVNVAMREDVATIRAAKLAMVLDADGLSAFADTPEQLFAQLGDNCVLTPHEGEFARLFPDLADRSASKIDRVRTAAARAGCVVVLKGPDSVIAAPHGRVYVNTNAPPYLATAGSGDVLAGIIGGLMAQGASGLDAAACGVWLHGAAGNFCGRGLIAGDLIEALPQILQTQL